MIELEFNNIMAVSQKYRHMLLSIIEFTDLLRPPYFAQLELITQKEILQAGLYAHIGNACCWITRTAAPGHISVSNEDITDPNASKWSIPVPLTLADPDYLERIINLKAFW